MARARFCTFPACTRRTRHATVRCFSHRPLSNGGHGVAANYGTLRTHDWTDEKGHLDRLDGPAKIEWIHDVATLEVFYVSGRKHRVGGPAKIERYENGVLRCESYYADGKLHRVDGYGITRWNPNGELASNIFVLADEGYLGAEGFAATIRSWSANRVEREFSLSSFAPLLDEDVPVEAILTALEAEVFSLNSIREIAAGAPVEWVRSFEDAA